MYLNKKISELVVQKKFPKMFLVQILPCRYRFSACLCKTYTVKFGMILIEILSFFW